MSPLPCMPQLESHAQLWSWGQGTWSLLLDVWTWGYAIMDKLALWLGYESQSPTLPSTVCLHTSTQDQLHCPHSLSPVIGSILPLESLSETTETEVTKMTPCKSCQVCSSRDTLVVGANLTGSSGEGAGLWTKLFPPWQYCGNSWMKEKGSLASSRWVSAYPHSLIKFHF